MRDFLWSVMLTVNKIRSFKGGARVNYINIILFQFISIVNLLIIQHVIL